MPGYTMFCTPCSLWELQHYQVLQLSVIEGKVNPWALKEGFLISFYIVQMEKRKMVTLLTCELSKSSSCVTCLMAQPEGMKWAKGKCVWGSLLWF